MTRVRLNRYFYGPNCTLGHMVVGASSVAPALIYTLELPWRGNEPRRSCIPDGFYECTPRRYNAGGYPAIEITGVPGRSHILFHRGNTASDVEGCVVVGTQVGILEGQLAVLGSAAAWARFFGELGSSVFELEVAPVFPLEGARL